MFALVDCNNFFASCERVFRPDLNHKPIVVLSNNDGCIIARSNEVKALKIPMGAAAFKYKHILEQKQVHVFSSNYALYGDMSKRVMNLLTDFTPNIEIYSIDEAFLKLDGFDNYNLQNYGFKIKRTIDKGTGIPISIGIAPTKSLAKVANRIAKKFPQKTKGVYVIKSENQRVKALKWLNIEDVWGIGKQYAKKLKNNGIYSAYDFTQQNDTWVKRNFSIVGLRLKKDLLGEAVIELEHITSKKSIATTRSFDYTYSDYETIKERVSTFAINCAQKLREQQSACNSILIFLKTNKHKQNTTQYHPHIVVQLPYPTNSSIDIVKHTIKGLKQIYKPNFQYKKAGVVVMDMVPEINQQLNLFQSPNPKHKKLMKTVDLLNNKLGYQKIKLACQDLKRTWKMKQEKLSPKYSTRLSDVIIIKLYRPK
ncbi:MAG TPA: Y-family DNA polymerase [Crocinitomix sp.]|nr:Y-family DNA polymerase [Crocinitomix sp.]